jgi:hypothetical protein
MLILKVKPCLSHNVIWHRTLERSDASFFVCHFLIIPNYSAFFQSSCEYIKTVRLTMLAFFNDVVVMFSVLYVTGVRVDTKEASSRHAHVRH